MVVVEVVWRMDEFILAISLLMVTVLMAVTSDVTVLLP